MSEIENFKKIIGRQIRLVRNEIGKTQAEFAEIIDVHEDHISRIERGLSLPTSYTIYKINQELNISLDKLTQRVAEEMKQHHQQDSEE